jgi:hypothetical protein
MSAEPTNEQTLEPQIQRLNSKLAYAVAAIAMLGSFLINKYFNSNIGWATGLFLIVVLFAIILYWQLRSQAWFWVTIGSITTIHIVGILLIPWPNTHWSAPALLPFAFLDLVVVLYWVKTVGRRCGGRQ